MPSLFASFLLWVFFLMILPDLVAYVAATVIAVVIYLIFVLLKGGGEGCDPAPDGSPPLFASGDIDFRSAMPSGDLVEPAGKESIESAALLPMQGLIIDNPWITMILDGRKTWEMRSTPTKKRATIALIAKGSGLVYGIARVVGCRGPLSDDEIKKYSHMHCVPFELIGKWRFAWELSEVRVLRAPVRYAHPKGAVVWVNLSEDICKAINSEVKLH